MPICPPDLFERLQRLISNPEEYNHLLAKTLQDLCNAILTGAFTWVDGVPYILDTTRGEFLSAHRPTLTAAYYGRNMNNRYLRIDGVATAGSQGFYCPRKGIITGLWAKSRSNGAWIFEVRKNGAPITLVSTNVLSGVGSNPNVDIDVNAGDWLQFYLLGTQVDHPIAVCELAWKL